MLNAPPSKEKPVLESSSADCNKSLFSSPNDICAEFFKQSEVAMNHTDLTLKKEENSDEQIYRSNNIIAENRLRPLNTTRDRTNTMELLADVNNLTISPRMKKSKSIIEQQIRDILNECDEMEESDNT